MSSKPYMKVLAKKCEECPYDNTCSMKEIVNHKIPCYAGSDTWIFRFIKKFGKGARVSKEMYK
jgi:hypothetical protein